MATSVTNFLPGFGAGFRTTGVGGLGYALDDFTIVAKKEQEEKERTLKVWMIATIAAVAILAGVLLYKRKK